MESSNKKIFIVDDDLSIGEILSAILEMEGFKVQFYNTGRDGVKKAQTEKPDLILLDYFLPGESAKNIVEAFRKGADKNLPILLMSASTQAEKMAKSLGVNDFIPKPFQRELLLESIEKNLN